MDEKTHDNNGLSGGIWEALKHVHRYLKEGEKKVRFQERSRVVGTGRDANGRPYTILADGREYYKDDEGYDVRRN